MQMLWANFTAVSKTSPYKTNAPARTSLIVGFLLMACVLLVKEHYAKHASTSKWQKFSQPIFVISRYHSDQVHMKEI